MAFSQNPFSVASFGESYEQADASVTLSGVSATGSTNDVTVIADALVVIDGVQATGAIDTNVVVAASCVVIPTSVAATASTNSVTVTGTALFTIDSVDATGSVNDVTVSADANAILTNDGVSATITVNGSGITFSLDCAITADSVSATLTLGTITVNTVQFDYLSLKENYSRNRTVYIKELTSNVNNFAYVQEEPRVVYVGSISSGRTVYVEEGKVRTVYIEEQPSENRVAYAQAA